MTIIAPGAAISAPEPSSATRRSAGTGASFTVPNATEPMEPQLGQPAAYSSSVRHPGAILALQEEQAGSAGKSLQVDDRDARRQARDMLKALTDLQGELLSGEGTTRALARLEELSSMVDAACEPGLASLLGAIRLRARLEILRHERRSPGLGGTALDGFARSK